MLEALLRWWRAPAAEEEAVQEESYISQWLWCAAVCDEVLASPSASCERLFQSTLGPEVFVRYKWDGAWRVAKVRSADPNLTATVVWEDGFLQVGTRRGDVSRPTEKVAKALDHARQRETPMIEQKEEPPQSSPVTSSVWELAKRGDVAGVLRLVDAGEASPNDLEEIDGQAGRSVLYHACHSGNADLVRALLRRGAFDWDNTCEIAVTGREKADDEKDLFFDPDSNTFSDFVDYDAQNM